MNAFEANQDYPKHWDKKRLGEVCKTLGGGTPKRSIKTYWGGSIHWLKIGDLNDSVIVESSECITRKGLEDSSAKLLPKGTVLLAIYAGASVGKAGILGIESATNQAIVGIIPNSDILDPYFLFLLLISKRTELQQKAFGGVQGNISHRVVKNILLPIPPLDEQKLITNIVNVTRHKIDSTTRELSRIPDLTRRFRLAILSKAFRGDLTERRINDVSVKTSPESLQRKHQDRAQMTLQQKPESIVLSNDQSGLPDAWQWLRFKDICEIQNGRAFPSSQYSDEGIRLLRPGNIGSNGRVFWTSKNTRYLPEEFAHRYPKYLIEEGEVVVNLTAQSLREEFLGRVAMMSGESPVLLNQRIGRLRPARFIEPSYLMYFMKCPAFRRFVNTLDSGTLIKHMYSWQLDDVQVPVAPLAEQKRIVTQIESSFALIGKVDGITTDNIERIKILERSVLSKAFKGQLITQTKTTSQSFQ